MSNMSDFENVKFIESKTPINVKLTGIYKHSFAFYTIKERLPVILTTIIDQLTRNRQSITQHGGNGTNDDLKYVIGEISKLKYEIQTNKPLKPFDTHEHSLSDVNVWNEYLQQLSDQDGALPRYFTTIWLLAECYMYRKLAEIVLTTKTLRQFDLFRVQKCQSFDDSYAAIKAVAKWICQQSDSYDPTDLHKLIKLNLWGNKCDLSLSLGKKSGQSDDPLDTVNLFDEFLICDNIAGICDILTKNIDGIVDIVHDNAGYELFTDFCLAHFLLKHKLVKKVRFHAKAIPWFISDVMEFDFHWMLDRMCEDEDVNIQSLGTTWKKFLQTNEWQLDNTEWFWTLPFGYTNMQKYDSPLYNKLSESKLVMLKGDLNYRKLLDDTHYLPTTPFLTAIQLFRPTNVCALRTLKADLICGLDDGVTERLDAKVDNWRVSGEYGVVQLAKK